VTGLKHSLQKVRQ